MKKAPDAFRTISEVADWLDVQAHVLRFWESKFTQVKPVKRAGGRRYYRPADMRLISGIKTLLHDEGMTIKGVQKILREKGVEHVSSLSRDIELAQAEVPDIIEAEVAEIAIDAAPEQDVPNVVTFQSRKARARATGPDEAAPEPDAASADPAAPEPETGPDRPQDLRKDPDAQTSEPEPSTESAGDTAPAAASDTPADKSPDMSPETAPDPAEETDAAVAQAKPREDLFEDEPDQPNLPSFLHRSARAAPEPEPAAPPEPEPETGPPAPRIVDAPDPPPEDEIEVSAGVLGRLAALGKLPPASVEPLGAIAAELRNRIGQDSGPV